MSDTSTDRRIAFELAAPIVCTKCGYESSNPADFMRYADGKERCVAYFACSRRQDEKFVAEKFGKVNS